MAFANKINPYANVAESAVTSQTVYLGGAPFSASWYTSAGTTSRVTLQGSNDPDLAEASFSVITANDGTALHHSSSSNYLAARVLRKVVESAASYNVDLVLFER